MVHYLINTCHVHNLLRVCFVNQLIDCFKLQIIQVATLLLFLLILVFFEPLVRLFLQLHLHQEVFGGILFAQELILVLCKFLVLLINIVKSRLLHLLMCPFLPYETVLEFQLILLYTELGLFGTELGLSDLSPTKLQRSVVD